MRTTYPRSRGRIALRLFAASALMAGATVPPENPGSAAGPVSESYYMVVYSAEKPNTPAMSHCFATFARVIRTIGTSETPRVELHHINWFSVRGHRCGSTFGLVEDDGRPTRAEPGENRTTRDALELVMRGDRKVKRWGPYEIDRGLYERAIRQIDLLEGRVPGRTVSYKAIDLGYREGSRVLALNCIHAVSDIVREPSPLRTWTAYGDDAARRVVLHLSPWIKGPATHDPAVWTAIWEAIWQGSTAHPADTIAREDLEPESEGVARRGRTGAPTGPVGLTGARASRAGQAAQVEAARGG